MSDETDALIDGLQERESSSRAILSWGGANYPCSGGAVKQGKVLQIGGFRPMADIEILVRKAVFPDGAGLPTLKQSVVFIPEPGGSRRALRVDSVNTFWDEIIVLGCNDPNQAT